MSQAAIVLDLSSACNLEREKRIYTYAFLIESGRRIFEATPC